ncbi:S8/S53 family peptidase [Roseovarius sp. M141]|uniref:S8/S53 family peptidase n=1 Tax=Roseovarius sp. M141 TaxID=2583806 RepID=UPI0020CF4D82
MIEIDCRNEHGLPISGIVDYTDPDGQEHCFVFKDGRFMVHLGTRLIHLMPSDGHWSTYCHLPPHTARASPICPSMQIDLSTSWWRAMMTAGTIKGCSAAGRLKVGVIDIPFRPEGSLSHVRIIDTDGNDVGMEDLPPTSHGQRVCRLLGARADGPDRGLLPDADMYLVDVSLAGAGWDFTKIAPAIETLAKVVGVDFINISGGSFCVDPEARPDFEDNFVDAVEAVEANGTRIFAAVGNDQSKDVAFPAALASVVGVGAIGPSGLAPEGTILAAYDTTSRDIDGAFGHLPEGQPIFHYYDTASGPGLNVVGPGMAIVMRVEDNQFMEYYGTSYACPIVLGAIAPFLDRTTISPDSDRHDGEEDWMERLRKLCTNLGMSEDRQGWGLPRPPNPLSSKE